METDTTPTCEFVGIKNIECSAHSDERRVNGKTITICDVHFYSMTDQAMSLW